MFLTPSRMPKQLRAGVAAACGLLMPHPGLSRAARVQKRGALPGTWVPVREATGACVWLWCSREVLSPGQACAAAGAGSSPVEPRRVRSPDSMSTSLPGRPASFSLFLFRH